MRQKRAKAYKKLMATYERVFGFRTPYQVLCTADFLDAATGMQLDIMRLISRTVSGEVKGMITQCCIKTLYDAKKEQVIRSAKTLERRRCGHIEIAKTEMECVLECLGSRNKNRYIVATQDRDLRNTLRQIPGVPLIYINRAVMILEPLSPATITTKQDREANKVGLSAEEAVMLGKRKREPRADEDVAELVKAPRARKRGPKEPNPLAVKKAQAVKPVHMQDESKPGPDQQDPTETNPDTDQRSRRKRRHKRAVKAAGEHKIEAT